MDPTKNKIKLCVVQLFVRLIIGSFSKNMRLALIQSSVKAPLSVSSTSTFKNLCFSLGFPSLSTLSQPSKEFPRRKESQIQNICGYYNRLGLPSGKSQTYAEITQMFGFRSLNSRNDNLILIITSQSNETKVFQAVAKAKSFISGNENKLQLKD